MIICSALASASSGCCVTRCSIAAQLCHRYKPVTQPTSVAFRMPFSSSANTWLEKIRFRPDSGFMRFKSNLSDLPLSSRPPSSIGAVMATSVNPAITGNSAHTAWRKSIPSWRSICLSLLTML
ncbi:hypothetical protein D3C75_985250 [compost metagenome]